MIPISPIPAANVATVPQRSPLRYPGGKTWLVPHIRTWLDNAQESPQLLIEPFAGGGVVSLTAVMEGLVERCLMAEIDPQVAAFWQAALYHTEELVDKVENFRATRENVLRIAQLHSADIVDRGFKTLVLNRVRRGGILTNGAGLIRSGESEKGIASRWYRDTIIRRLRMIGEYGDRIEFCETDGIGLLEKELNGDSGRRVTVFVDPPYTAGGKSAGRRLYTHNRLDHRRLFSVVANGGSDFLMTYDETPEILELVESYSLCVARVTMKNTHHVHRGELIITKRQLFI